MREPVLLTPRLVLRDVTEADAEALVELDSDPAVTRYIGLWPPPTVEWFRDRIRTVYMPQQEHPWRGVRMVDERATGTFLGMVFVRPAHLSKDAAAIGWTSPTEEEVGYRFHQAAWGHGYATEAAMVLANRAWADPATTALVACADVENVASIRVLEKLGLVRFEEKVLPGEERPIVTMVRQRTPCTSGQQQG